MDSTFPQKAAADIQVFKMGISAFGAFRMAIFNLRRSGNMQPDF